MDFPGLKVTAEGDDGLRWRRDRTDFITNSPQVVLNSFVVLGFIEE